MKAIVTLFALLSISLIYAQAPDRMTYQAVIRNASDALVSNAPVGVQISILQGSPTGVAQYIETHTPTTNINGLVTFEIGGGTIVAGNFGTIDWSQGPYFLKTDTDPTGGTVYTISATTQLLSVPYALHAETATNVDDADSDPTNEIQSLSVNGTDLTISSGNTITLPGGGNTLDEAYDQGGAGLGRTITADAGAVEIINSGTNTTGLDVSTSVLNSTGVLSTHSGIGVAFRAESSNAANSFSAIQANTNSATANNAAILGNNSGAGYGVTGQVPATASGGAGVYGSNLRTTGGNGVLGIGFNGIVGQSSFSPGYGVYGSNSNLTGLAIGTYGIGFNGVYGQTTDVINGWSGYFTQDIGVDGTGYSLGGWLTVSDKRLKSNIELIESPLDRILQLNGRTYTLTTKSKPVDGELTIRETQQYGVIAQEVEAVFPEMVQEKAVFNNAGDDTLYKTVNYDQLVPVLIESLRELNEKVESLEAELEELKSE
ncbi:tail fiber domain-containing protein [Crocinitomicaceae bacterium]|nr:tail fiber domain-containing protein [Crocinitomicaceae bacterium]MDC0257353.1 tail fiber domain-containing protein [Crocinitomicaceae bacterium]